MHRIARAAAVAWLSVACSSKGEFPSVERADVTAMIEEACPTITDPDVYRLDKDGITSWILGTRHISVALGKFPQKLLARIRSAKAVVLELSPDEMAAAKTTYTGKPLRELLGDTRWDKYRELVGDARATATQGPLQAFAAIAALYENKDVVLEKEITAYAQESRVPVQGLETAALQRTAFTDMLASTQMLDKMIDSTTRAMVRATAAKALQAYCTGTERFPAKLDPKLLDDRNHAWIPKIEALHATGGVFIAVGAAHLQGDKGVLALLQADGFTATRTLDN